MNASKFKQYRNKIKAALNRIENNLEKDISLSELAQISEFSDHHFHRVFKLIVGENLKQYVRRLRLEKAAQLVVFNKHPITDIAKKTGFHSHESFIRAFKRQYGLSPSKSRNFLSNTVKSYFHHANTLSYDAIGLYTHKKINKLVTIKETDDILVYYSRIIGPYKDANVIWLTLLSEIGSDVFFDTDSVFYAITHDLPGITEVTKCRFDACIQTPYSSQIQKKLIQGGLFACFNYQPDHRDLHGFLSNIIDSWLPNSGYSYRQQPIHYKLENISAMATDFSNNPEVEIFIPISPSSNSG